MVKDADRWYAPCFERFAMTMTRDIALDPKHSAVLFIDVQNFSAHKDGAEFKDCPADVFTDQIWLVF